ncbi:hypothetical protein FO519_006949 [Halicephalobus sp. NKZ332]|nr:hypothetical protein FO519_006949 [Halicephalobus sp. NKZ332]
MFKPVLIPPDIPNSEAAICFTSSLLEIHNASEAIFERLEKRLNLCQKRAQDVCIRIDAIDKKVKTLGNAENATLTYLSRYPDAKLNPLSAIFENDNFQSYSQKSTDKVVFKDDPVNSQKIKEALLRKKDFGYAFGSGKHLEALKPSKVDEDSDSDRYELIDEELIYAEKGKKQTISGKYELESDSLLIYDSIGKGFEGDPFAYKPELGALNTFDFPDLLPNLSGIRKTEPLDEWTFPSIAPSARQAGVVPGTQGQVDLTAPNNMYHKPVPQQSPKPEPVKEVPKAPEMDLPKDIPFLAPAPPPPPPAVPTQLPPPPVPTGIPSIPISTPSVPVGPLLPALPVLTDVSKGRSDLMEAIRNAGGAHKAKLKSVTASPSTEKPVSPASKVAEDTGDDLMSSLAKALELRRKGISGGAKKKFEKLENRQKSTPEGAFSRLRDSMPIIKKEDASDQGEKVVPDKGFFVRGDIYQDEYIAATAADVPEDEMNECPYHFIGDNDAVETISFQLPGQCATNSKETPSTEEFDEDEEEWKANYSTEDSSVTVEVKSACSGCGAKLHCQDSALPGFVPVQIIQKVVELESQNSRRKKKVDIDELCRRCYMLKNHNFLLNVNICQVDYVKLMGHLKMTQEALTLLVVDMTDIRGSIYRQLPDIIGDAKPMIVIGNKVDLLPPDVKPGYLKRFKNTLMKELEESGLSRRFNIVHTGLVSAKTGYGIEDLVTNIYLKWMDPKGKVRSDIYVVGCTNAGKSTLFNAFLQSDLCKVRAIDLVERVTTSVWPGTTLSLLKFPLMNPSSYKLELRRRRLLSLRAWTKKEATARFALYSKTKDAKYLTLSGVIENSFKEKLDESNPISGRSLSQAISHCADSQNKPEEIEQAKHGVKLTDVEFTQGHWCFDTPGTVNNEQLLDLYTLNELITLVPRRLIFPKTFILKAGESLLFGGTGRIDVMSSEKPVFLTTFCSGRLPLTVIQTRKVEDYLEKYRGTKILAVPMGDERRLKKFPNLEGREIKVESKSQDEASMDVVMSTIGWVAVSGDVGEVSLNVMTPEGRGISTRDPLLKFAVQYRGNRIPGTSEYKTRPLRFEFEENFPNRKHGKDRK